MFTDKRVLVTGASGFLGQRIVAMLVERGFSVRALVRKTSKTNHLCLPGVELYYGDVTNAESMVPAFEGVGYVIHAAAGTGGAPEIARRVTVEGTRNILDLCVSHSIKKLVYISSCSVYGVADYETGQVVDEDASLERFPERRGVYSLAKLEAENLVTGCMAQGKIAAVCLRPGTIYGCGGENFTPMVGFSIGNKLFVVIGDGSFVMPLVYIDNLVEAIIVAMTGDNSIGQVYNVVDLQKVDKKSYMECLIHKLYPQAIFLYFPRSLFSAIVAVQELVFRVLRRPPILTTYRLTSSQKPIFYNASKIMNDLGWRSSVSFEEAVDRIIEHEQIKL